MYSDRIWHGKWVCAPHCPALAAPVFRVHFDAPQVQNACVFVSGVGFYVLYINGKRVGDHQLAPAFTAYDKTVCYNEFDVTELLKPGDNLAEIYLGNGWFNEVLPTEWDFEYAAWKNTPQFILDLVADGQILLTSDRRWQAYVSRTVYNTLRYGETYDASKEETPCGPVQYTRGPGGYLKKQTIEPIRVRHYVQPCAVRHTPSGQVYDFGVNLTGNAEIRLRGEKGQKITLLYTERISPDGSADPANNNMYAKTGRFQQEEYICAGQGEECWHSQFCYHGFRYVQLTGAAQVLSLTARCFHTDLQEAGGIQTDFEPVQKLHDACVRSTLTNFHHIPTDCPHREKNGWTGDAHASAEQALFNLDMKAAYLKFLDDLVDGQRPNGTISCISPTGSWGYNGWPTWDAVLFELPWQLYRYTGDLNVLKRYVQPQAKYLDMLRGMTDDHIYRNGLGDWCAPGRMTTCSESMLLTVYAYYIHQLHGKICALLGMADQSAEAFLHAKAIRDAFKRTFIGAEPNSQTYLAALLYFDLAQDPQQTVEALLHEIEKADGHMVCGFFGAKFLLNVLTDHGHFGAAWKVLLKEGYPGYLDMLSRCSGTLAEDWAGENSQNHHMFSEVGAWFYKALAGIRIQEEGAGFTQITLHPHIPDEIRHFSAWHDTPLGRLEVFWDENHYTAVLPEGCTASVVRPQGVSIMTGTFTLPRQEFAYTGESHENH